MAGSLPSGTFSSAYAGKLRVTLSGQFFSQSYTTNGAPSTGQGILTIKAYAGPSGTPVYSPVLEKTAGMVSMLLDYPGGSVVWSVGAVEVTHVNPGTVYSYGWQDMVLACELEKK